jgi:uncharacterized protein YjiS (DUF1127 family)
MTFMPPSLSIKDTAAMTLYELDMPRTDTANSLWSGIRHRIGGAIRAMQYARMRQAMSELSDSQLAQIGLARADIARHARQCVYEDS